MKKSLRDPIVLLTVLLTLNAAVLVWLGLHSYRSYFKPEAVVVLGVASLLSAGWFAVYRAERKRVRDALQFQSEILTNMSEGVVLIRADDGIIVYTNRAFEEMFAYSPGEMVGKHISTVNAPTDRSPEEIATEIMNCLNRTGTWIGRIKNIKKDGTTFWCYTTVSVLDHQKHGKTFVATHMDITQHMENEQALLESEKRFRTVFDNAGDPIVVADEETLRIRDFNDKACETLGYARDEFAKLTIADINAVESMEDLKKHGEIAFRDGSISFDTKHKTKIGKIRDVSVTIAVVGMRDEKLRVCVWQDITKRKKVMDEIQQLAKFPNENPHPVLRVSVDGVLIYANQASLPLLNNWGISIGEPLVESWNCHVRKSYSAGRDRQIEEGCGDRIISLTFAPVEGAGYVNIYGLDVTERRKAEEDVRAASRQWESTFNAIGDAVCLLDKDRNILKCNTAAAKTLGGPPSSLVGKNLCEMAHGSSEMRDGCPFLRMRESGRRRTQELELGDRYLDVCVDPVFDASGDIVGGVHVVTDITRRKRAEKALREERDFAKNLLDMTQAIVLVLDTGGQVVSFNPYMEEISGYTLEEVKGKDWVSTFLPARDHTKARNLFEKAVDNIQTRGNVNPIVTKDGREREIEWYDKMLKDADGNVVGLLATGRDITERKAAQEEMGRLLKAVETAREAINITTPGGYLIYTNNAMDELFGYEKGELIGVNAQILNAGSMSGEVLQRIIESIEEKNWWEGEIHNKRKDGTEFFSYATVSATRDEDGNIVNVIATQHDITERKRMMEMVRESEKRFRMLFEEGPLGMAILDCDLRMIAVNTALCEMLGYSADELSGLTMPDITHPNDADVAMKCVSKLFSGRISRFQIENRYAAKDGRIVWGNLAASMIPAPEGRPVYALAVVEDITERKDAEERLRLYQKQLRSLSSKLTLAEERQRKEIATALHDGVCQTLGMAKMKLDLLRSDIPRGKESEDLIEVCRMLGQAIQDTRTLTFDLSSPILYQLGLEAALGELVGEHIGRRHGIRCEFEDDEQPKMLDHDTSLLLYQSVRELLVNIVKYAKADKVKVSIQKDTDTVEIVVEDNGVGFNPGDDAVVRPDRTGRFGLFSIRERLGYLGGDFEIKSAPNSGTRAVLTAPLATDG